MCPLNPLSGVTSLKTWSKYKLNYLFEKAVKVEKAEKIEKADNLKK